MISQEQRIDALITIAEFAQIQYEVQNKAFYYELDEAHVYKDYYFDPLLLAKRVNVDISLLPDSPLGGIGLVQSRQAFKSLFLDLKNNGLSNALLKEQNVERFFLLFKEADFVLTEDVRTALMKTIRIPSIERFFVYPETIASQSTVNGILSELDKSNQQILMQKYDTKIALDAVDVEQRSGLTFLTNQASSQLLITIMKPLLEQAYKSPEEFIRQVHGACYQRDIALSVYHEGTTGSVASMDEVTKQALASIYHRFQKTNTLTLDDVMNFSCRVTKNTQALSSKEIGKQVLADIKSALVQDKQVEQANHQTMVDDNLMKKRERIIKKIKLIK